MSATINEADFAAYFGGAPSRSIAGRTHPVQDHYLEDFLSSLSGFRPSPSSRPAGKIKADDLKVMQAGFRAEGVTDEGAVQALCTLARSDRIDYDLLGATVAMLAAREDDGRGILVFMTGVAEIRRASDAIRAATPNAIQLDILSLHANMSSQDQARAFRPPRKGARKVVVATNVAETSITIDDVRMQTSRARADTSDRLRRRHGASEGDHVRPRPRRSAARRDVDLACVGPTEARTSGSSPTGRGVQTLLAFLDRALRHGRPDQAGDAAHAARASGPDGQGDASRGRHRVVHRPGAQPARCALGRRRSAGPARHRCPRRRSRGSRATHLSRQSSGAAARRHPSRQGVHATAFRPR